MMGSVWGKRCPSTTWQTLPRTIPIVLGLSLFLSSCGGYDITINNYDPLKAFHGTTIYTYVSHRCLQAIDMEGNLVWEFNEPFGHLVGDFEILEDGDVLFISNYHAYRLTPPDRILWEWPTSTSHHCVIPIPNGNIMYLFSYTIDVEGFDRPFNAHGVREMDPSNGQTVWEWRECDHLSTADRCPVCINTINLYGHLDWTHTNTIVFREDESAVYLNIRNFNRIVKIDYPSGDIIWQMGDGGDFGEGLWSHSHDPHFLPNGNIVMFDNGNHKAPVEYSRAVEIAFDPVAGWAEEVWAWPESPDFYDWAMGDANRLPNGNTLITDSQHGKLFEVTPEGEVVWEMFLAPHIPFMKHPLYKADRVTIY